MVVLSKDLLIFNSQNANDFVILAFTKAAKKRDNWLIGKAASSHAFFAGIVYWMPASSSIEVARIVWASIGTCELLKSHCLRIYLTNWSSLWWLIECILRSSMHWTEVNCNDAFWNSQDKSTLIKWFIVNVVFSLEKFLV